MQHYILDGKIPVQAQCFMEFALWFESANRTVKKTTIGDAEVSTVFLGIDHRFIGDGPPVLFETTIFGGECDQDTWRYVTWAEAEAGHDHVVSTLQGSDG